MTGFLRRQRPRRLSAAGRTLLALMGALLSVLCAAGPIGCSRCTQREIAAARYAPAHSQDWNVSTPAEQGLDPALVGRLYCQAAKLDKLYGLLVVKNGHLVAEGYFNGGSVDQRALLQSATKSYVSALVGIALAQGCLTSLDQRMIAFFPDLSDGITDPRKRQITLRQLLQMRSGYPWEESDRALWERFLEGDWLPLIVETPLVSDPGAEHHYSNLTSYILAVIVARACNTDLSAFAQRNLFSPLGTAESNVWGYPGTPVKDKDGYTYPNLRATARSAAKLGQLYLDDGNYRGRQILSADWVRDSLTAHTADAWISSTLGGFEEIAYGHQWWSGRAGNHRAWFAWGHGGQLVVLIEELDMVIVTTADPFFRQHDGESWQHEEATIELVSEFIESLPSS
ncbi:MAG: serine hydrolase [Deltaproteobacteria bacterium]|nr:serine hydrolase [Deltaproteobacteria bacterium]